MDDCIASQKRIRRTALESSFANTAHRMRVHHTARDAREITRRFGGETLSPTLFSRGKITKAFFTADSHRYATPLEQRMLVAGIKRFERNGRFDSVQARFTYPARSVSQNLYEELRIRYEDVWGTLRYFPDMLSAHLSPVRVWNASIVGAIFFGMFSMTLIYRYLGQSASADERAAALGSDIVAEASLDRPTVLGASTEDISDHVVLPATHPAAAPMLQSNFPNNPVETALQKNVERELFEAAVKDLVKDYPIERMLPYIFKQDRDVATFLVAIGKKESNWGKRVPVLDGKDCYNYWGYRGIRDKMGTGGHTCFDSPEDAVTAVAKRIKTLVQEKKLDTPSKMIVWKCGSTCAGHSADGVRKWISDVQMYVDKLN
jgi:hypothetical protein